MTMDQIYKGKTVLLTGVTGFVGKVILQKFLYSLPSIKKIYVLIREKKGSNLKQRFAREIISSPCFDRIRNVHHNKFFEYINEKVQPIQGDIVKPNLNLSIQDMQKLMQNCTIIINCAASIDFNARLDEALKSNIVGSLNMLELAHKLENCQIFTHVSTAYVNCDKTGFIKEDIYQNGVDPQEQFKFLTSLPLKQLIEQTPILIKKFPNTYTFTKNLGEKLLSLRRKNLTMCIIRPTIINNGYYQPFPGWMDSIAAAAAFFLFGGLGILKQVIGEKYYIGDQIPVDLVSNYILVATAFNINKNNHQIYHIGTSDRNPTKWSLAEPIIRDYWKSNVSQYRISQPNGIMSNNLTVIKLHKLKQRIPAYIYFRLAPFMGKEHVRKTEKMKKAFKRADEIQGLFRFFMTNQWIFQMRRIKDLLNFLSQADKKAFVIDPAELDMRYYYVLNNYALQKYILKENVQLPTADNFDLLKSGSKKSYFSDISWALTQGSPNMKYGQGQKIKRQILMSKIMLQAIQDQTLRRIEKSNANIILEKKKVQRQAQNIVKQIVGQFKQPIVRLLAWALHKIFKRLYEKVNLNQQIFQKLREIQEVNQCPIVLMPTHRSYIDFLMVSYIMFHYKLKMPFVVSDQSYLSIKVVDYFVSNSGAFFFKQGKYKTSHLYKVAFDQYIQKLLIQGNNLEFFIEGIRSNTGKMLQPQTQILQILVDCVANDKVKDVCIVPLTINYQKVLQGYTLPAELLGQDREQQSLLRLIKAAPLLNINFGRVYIQFADFVFLKNELTKTKSKSLSLNKTQSQNIKQLSLNFGYNIIKKLQNKLVIMSTGVVATALLMYRKGVTQDLLLKTVHWLAKYILKKGYKIGSINQNSAALAIRNAMNYLSGVINKTKNSIFQLQITPGRQFEKLLMLSYYRNTVFHAFLPEAFIGTALASFGSHLSKNEGIPVQRLYQQSSFLRDMFRAEHVVSWMENFDYESFKKCLYLMIRYDVILFKDKQQTKVIFKDYQEKFILLYCSIMKPLVQCYWAVLLYLMTIASSPNQVQQINSLEKFFRYIQYYMEALHDQKVIQNHEACSMQTIKNAFESFRKRGLVTVTVQSKHLVRIQAKAKQLQAYKQLESVLMNFVKNSLVTSLISPMDFAKNLVIGSQLSKL